MKHISNVYADLTKDDSTKLSDCYNRELAEDFFSETFEDQKTIIAKCGAWDFFVELYRIDSGKFKEFFRQHTYCLQDKKFMQLMRINKDKYSLLHKTYLQFQDEDWLIRQRERLIQQKDTLLSKCILFLFDDYHIRQEILKSELFQQIERSVQEVRKNNKTDHPFYNHKSPVFLRYFGVPLSDNLEPDSTPANAYLNRQMKIAFNSFRSSIDDSVSILLAFFAKDVFDDLLKICGFESERTKIVKDFLILGGMNKTVIDRIDRSKLDTLVPDFVLWFAKFGIYCSRQSDHWRYNLNRDQWKGETLGKLVKVLRNILLESPQVYFQCVNIFKLHDSDKKLVSTHYIADIFNQYLDESKLSIKEAQMWIKPIFESLYGWAKTENPFHFDTLRHIQIISNNYLKLAINDELVIDFITSFILACYKERKAKVLFDFFREMPDQSFDFFSEESKGNACELFRSASIVSPFMNWQLNKLSVDTNNFDNILEGYFRESMKLDNRLDSLLLAQRFKSQVIRDDRLRCLLDSCVRLEDFQFIEENLLSIPDFSEDQKSRARHFMDIRKKLDRYRYLPAAEYVEIAESLMGLDEEPSLLESLFRSCLLGLADDDEFKIAFDLIKKIEDWKTVDCMIEIKRQVNEKYRWYISSGFNMLSNDDESKSIKQDKSFKKYFEQLCLLLALKSPEREQTCTLIIECRNELYYEDFLSFIELLKSLFKMGIIINESFIRDTYEMYINSLLSHSQHTSAREACKDLAEYDAEASMRLNELTTCTEIEFVIEDKLHACKFLSHYDEVIELARLTEKTQKFLPVLYCLQIKLYVRFGRLDEALQILDKASKEFKLDFTIEDCLKECAKDSPGVFVGKSLEKGVYDRYLIDFLRVWVTYQLEETSNTVKHLIATLPSRFKSTSSNEPALERQKLSISFVKSLIYYEANDYAKAYESLVGLIEAAATTSPDNLKIIVEAFLMLVMGVMPEENLLLSIDEKGTVIAKNVDSSVNDSNTSNLPFFAPNGFDAELDGAMTMSSTFEPKIWHAICVSKFILFEHDDSKKEELADIRKILFERLNGVCSLNENKLNMTIFRFIRLLKFYTMTGSQTEDTEVLCAEGIQDRDKLIQKLDLNQLEGLKNCFQSLSFKYRVYFAMHLMKLDIDEPLFIEKDEFVSRVSRDEIDGLIEGLKDNSEFQVKFLMLSLSHSRAREDHLLQKNQQLTQSFVDGAHRKRRMSKHA